MATLFSSFLLDTLSDDELQNYVFKEHTWAKFEYRYELSRRFALTFDADHLFVFDDIAMVTGESERMMSLSAIQGCDRSLLPALWLAMGFEYGATIIVYAPPNPIELREFISIKNNFETKLQRTIRIRILFNGYNDIFALYEKSIEEYTKLCMKYMTELTFRPKFTSEYHVEQLKKYANEILDHIQNKRRSLVFPFEVTPYHVQELSDNKRLILPDLPTNDKAKHNFVLRYCGFNKLPLLFMVCVDGTIVDSYDVYEKTMASLSTIDTKNTLVNIERFARAIIIAIDRLNSEYGLSAFVKLDAAGAGGWSCMSPEQHPTVYNTTLPQLERITYIIDYITTNVIDQHLPTHAVVEEYIEAELRPGNIPADYTVCGLLLNGKFFPTSINLCGTDNNGQYIEQWTAANAEYLNDNNNDWIKMFETYKQMSQTESNILKYFNGIYAGDLFLSKTNHEHKQRDWNIRRGGRSTPETLIMINKYDVNYECKVSLKLDKYKLTSEQIFFLYTSICDELSKQPYNMYPFSTGYLYFGQFDNDYFLKFNFIINPRIILDNQQKFQYHEKIDEIVENIVSQKILCFVNSQ